MKLFIISNRLPLTIKKKGDSFIYKENSGGLVTGIKSLSNCIDLMWVGNIPNDNFNINDINKIKNDLLNKFKSIPVFINDKLNDMAYNGFSNSILWPLFHNFPDAVNFSFDQYKAYEKYNKVFSKVILKNICKDDVVWIHDYHLMLLPGFLKRKIPNLKVLFFLHISFCEFDNLKPLLVAKKLFKEVSKSNFVAFHLPEYSINFITALKRLNIKNTPLVKSISIGIDPFNLREIKKNDQTLNYIKKIKNLYKDKKIVLSVDRTDYIKGITLRNKAIELFYEKNPDQINKVIFLQIAIPSRVSVLEYSSYIKLINRQIQEINGKIGDLNCTSIKMLFDTVNINELVALYSISDIILITSVIDGMNLVALEYVSCQDENYGLVILSKFAGASITLKGSLLHNSNNTEKIAKAIKKGLFMSKKERKQRHLLNKINLEKFTSLGWIKQNLKGIGINLNKFK